MGGRYTGVYHFKDGVAREVIELRMNNGGIPFGNEITFQINGKDVSESLYNAAYEPYSEESFYIGEGLIAVDPEYPRSPPRRVRTIENGSVVRNHFITKEAVMSALLDFQK